MTRPLLAAFLLLLPAAVLARPALDKPNVIVVLIDDAGYGDFSHTGNPTIHTPNISRMVSEGLNFPQFYTGSPACSAARYSILTGRNPVRSGFGAFVLAPAAKPFIHPKEVTIAEGLKHRGYATAIFGKWHIGTPNEANKFDPAAFPLANGFDRWLGTNVSHDYLKMMMLIRTDPNGNAPIHGYDTLETNFSADPAIVGGLTKRYTDAAIDFINEKKDGPFFIYLAPNMPHLPVHASPEFKGKSLHGEYGDCIEEIDSNLGRIAVALQKAGVSKNTLMIFTSDNGPWIGFQNTVKCRYGEARALIGSALPFRDGKGSTWEGGQREPGVFWWPGTIRPGTVIGPPASTFDVLPTVFALAGEPLPKDRTLDGRDIRPYFNPDLFPGTVRPFTFAYAGNGNAIFCFRKGPWKLHVRIGSQTGNNYGFTASLEKPLLFNVEEDPGERIDRAADHPEIVDELRKLLVDYAAAAKKEGSFSGITPPLPGTPPRARPGAAKPAEPAAPEKSPAPQQPTPPAEPDFED